MMSTWMADSYSGNHLVDEVGKQRVLESTDLIRNYWILSTGLLLNLHMENTEV